MTSSTALFERRMRERPTEGLDPDDLCSEDLKTCEVRFSVDNRDDDVIHGIHPHFNERGNTYPLISTAQPFRGKLCRHEREYLLKEPGRGFSKHWAFEVKVEGVLQRIFGHKEAS